MIESAMREAQDAVDLSALEAAMATGIPSLALAVVDGAVDSLEATLRTAAMRTLDGGVRSVVQSAMAAGAGASELCVTPAAWPVDDDAVRWSASRGAPTRATWESELTTAERAALERYTQGGEWRTLNEALRAGSQLPDDLAEMAQLIDSAIEKAGMFAPEARPIVWRGINLGNQGMPKAVDMIGLNAVQREEAIRNAIADYAEQRFVSGSVVEMKGYQSSSHLVEPALDASLSRTNPGIVFEIRASGGAHLDTISKLDDEAELLLGRNSSFRVIKVLRDAQFETSTGAVVRRTVVQLEQVR